MEIEDLELNSADSLWDEKFGNDYPEVLCKKKDLEILLWSEYNDEGGSAGSYKFETDKYKFYYSYCDSHYYDNGHLKQKFVQNDIVFSSKSVDVRIPDSDPNGFIDYLLEDLENIKDLTVEIVNLKFEEWLEKNGVTYD